MKTSHSFEAVPLADIIVAEDRQRKKFKNIEELALSLKNIGLLQPIIIDRNLNLIAGQRRLRAAQLLKWETIPCHYIDEVTNLEAKIIELEENVKREDLTWQEQTVATAEFHELKLKLEDRWTLEKSAVALNTVHSQISTAVVLAEEIKAGNKLICDAATKNTAHNYLKRKKQRKQDDAISKIEVAITTDDLGELEITAPKPKELAKYKEKAPFQIITNDFITWADDHTRVEKYNFMHCDFPYGINHGESKQGKAEVYGKYEDSPELYWDLLRCLGRNLDTLLYSSAHVIFWFSMKYYSETVEFFEQETDLVLVQEHPLIWHKTDNKGIVADVARRPRHVYETALFLSRGDRKIIQPVSDCYGGPTLKADAVHLSEKSEAMLRHFFRMVCDDLTEMLDPTCGGGSAIRAALSLGAKKVLGVEVVSEYSKIARKKTKSAWALEQYSQRKNNASDTV